MPAPEPLAPPVPPASRTARAGGLPGWFVAFEGGDGSGKSTQIARLAEGLRALGREVVVTREPGGSDIGRTIRSIVLGVGTVGLGDRAEALLYAADRAHHVESVVRPALARGAVVLTDRYLDSSLAYQGAGRELPVADVEALSLWATGGLLPDLTVVLDLDPAVAEGRGDGTADRLESEPLAFHRRVREGFLRLARRDPSRYAVVDAAGSVEQVAEAVRAAVDAVVGAAPSSTATPHEAPETADR